MINAPAVPGKDAPLGKVLTGTNPGDELRSAACSRQFDRFLRRPDGPEKVVCPTHRHGPTLRGIAGCCTQDGGRRQAPSWQSSSGCRPLSLGSHAVTCPGFHQNPTPETMSKESSVRK